MDQQSNKGQNEFLWALLANPADDAHLYAFNLQRLVNDFPQSGILQALLAHASDDKNLRQASVYFNARSLYKLVNAPSGLTGVSAEKIILQPGIGTNGYFQPAENQQVGESPLGGDEQNAGNGISENRPEAEDMAEPGSETTAVHTDDTPPATAEDIQHSPETTGEQTGNETETPGQQHPALTGDAHQLTQTTGDIANNDLAAAAMENQGPAMENAHAVLPAPEPVHTELPPPISGSADMETSAPVPESVHTELPPPTPGSADVETPPPVPESVHTELPPPIPGSADIETLPPVPEQVITAEEITKAQSEQIDAFTQTAFTEPEPANASAENTVAVEPAFEKHAEEAAPIAEEPVAETSEGEAEQHIAEETFDEIVGIDEIRIEPLHIQSVDEMPVTDAIEEENLIKENIAATDFFMFDQAFGEHKQAEAGSNGQAAAAEYTNKSTTAADADHQDVSKYHDEKMPYSFMWWLDKTRKEHSGVYQPYIKPETINISSKPKKPADELQQQYFENIFHITSVEDLDKHTPPPSAPYNIKRKEQVIIDRFIKEEPQIKPQSSDKLDNENKAKKSSEDRDELVTETLAGIYSDQMLYHKAIASYKKLMLKFPEKSRYFAGKIEQLEKKTN